ncbi:helix-turn-helix domain-containing protein [Catellatospora coxensis]
MARRANVGKATLSGLENGTRNPTLDTLWSVTAALGVPITALLAGGQTGVVRGTAVEATLLQVFDDEAVTYELYRMVVPPGAVQSSPAHHAGVTEHITVFSGVLRAAPPTTRAPPTPASTCPGSPTCPTCTRPSATSPCTPAC